jgi:hypothetical protein
MPAGRMPKQGEPGRAAVHAAGSGLHGLRLERVVTAPVATHREFAR